MYKYNLYGDIKAGIVVFLVALPLCLGISLACNVPLFSGILAGVIGGTIVCAFSGSMLSVSGPAAGLTSIVISSVALLGSFESFLACAVVAGLIQIGLGFIRVGNLGNYFPYAVIKGMLAGIGIILIINQIPHLFGYDADPESDMFLDRPDGHNSFTDLMLMLDNITPGAVIIGVVSLGFLMLTEMKVYKESKLLAFFPAPLVIVLFGMLMSRSLNSHPGSAIDPEHYVLLPVINSFVDLTGALTHPDFSLILSTKFWITSFTIAFVASLETLLSIDATDKLDPQKRKSNSNKELIAQGIGNTLAGLLGALPLTAVIVRSSANINAGAKTKLAAMIHALLLLLTILLIPNVLMLIPNASLAAILIMTGYKLAKPAMFTEQYKKGIEHILPFVVTVLGMLVTDLLKGVTAGLVVSVFFIIRSNVRATFDVAKAEIDGRLHYVLKLPQHLTFFNKGFLVNFFAKVEQGSKVIVDGSVNKISDKDALEVIHEFADHASEKKIEVQFAKFDKR
jgi:MFS superfamily sulfate permease-like transporter